MGNWARRLNFTMLLGALGCGSSVGELVRKDEHSAAEALKARVPTCSDDARYAKVLAVDWDPDERVDLEAAMKQGPVLVKYDCQSLQVLGHCQVPGSYQFAGVSLKERVVQLQDQDQLVANLPLSAAKFGGELRSGRSIDIAMVMIGKRSTTMAKLTASDSANCDEATHFVRSASIGAFAIATGSIGKVAAAAELFGIGSTGAKSESKRKSVNRDGSVDACRSSDPDAEKPPKQCRSPIKIELVPITENRSDDQGRATAKGATDKPMAVANPCPPGYDFSNGLCQKLEKKSPRLCAANDEADCRTQCKRGHAGSCLNLASIVRTKKSLNEAGQYYEMACNKGSLQGCAAYGHSLLPSDGSRAKQVKKAMGVLHAACRDGSGDACNRIGESRHDDYYHQKDLVIAAKAYRRACLLGSGSGCYSIADMYFSGQGVPKNVLEGMRLLVEACNGDVDDTCGLLARIWESGKHGVVVDKKRAQLAYRRACRSHWSDCEDSGRLSLELGDYDIAVDQFKRACSPDNGEGACYELGMLYDTGKGVTADPKQAAHYFKLGCQGGAGSEAACAKAGK